MEGRAGLTEVQVNIEGKHYRTLVDTGSEISVIAENIFAIVIHDRHRQTIY